MQEIHKGRQSDAQFPQRRWQPFSTVVVKPNSDDGEAHHLLSELVAMALHLRREHAVSTQDGTKGTNSYLSAPIAASLLLVFFLSETGPTGHNKILMCAPAIVILWCDLEMNCENYN